MVIFFQAWRYFLFAFLFILARLHALPDDLYEAAAVDGAVPSRRFWYVTLPAALEEAALIDGCTRLEVIRHVVISLSLPALASVALYVFMIAWNEFLFALLWLLERPDAWTLSLGVQQLESQEVPRTWLMAGSCASTSCQLTTRACTRRLSHCHDPGRRAILPLRTLLDPRPDRRCCQGLIHSLEALRRPLAWMSSWII